MRQRSIFWVALAAGVSLLAGTGCGRGENTVRAQAAENIPGAQPDIHIPSPLPNGEWRMATGDYGNVRFSPLAQLNSGNIGKLHVISTMATGIPHGHEGGPLILNNTMYVVTPFPNNLIAVDLKNPNGPTKWVYHPYPDPRAQGVACCDVVNRGASYADGKIVYNTLDNQTVAVDAETGKEIWKTRVGDINYGETTTMAPTIVRNHVYVGNSGGELGVRGKLISLDLKTGKEQWRAWSTGSDADTLIGPSFKPFYPKDRGKDLGVKSWPPDQWKMGGGTIWGWISYDPETNLIFYGTGNAGVWNPDQRPGDNKWSCSIIARDADTGQARWAYQVGPHDEWDYDEINEEILVDMNWHGSMRKVIIYPGRNGFLMVIDRETGELLAADSYEPSTNWASGFDLKTGMPKENPDKKTHQGKNVENICPSATGGKDFIPSSFSPRTGYVYIPAHNTCMNFEGQEASYIAGTPYLGASVRMFAGPGGYQGELIAWDVKNQKRVWSVKDEKLPVWSGVLSTGGDIVFYGTMEGWFRAVDARQGKVLWQYKTPSGIISNPVTFLGPDGKQYVAVYSGVGGWMGVAAFPDVSTDDPYAALGTVGATAALKENTAPAGLVYVFGL